MTLKYESDRCHLPPPGAFGGEDSDRKRVGRGFHHVGRNTESGHPRSRSLAVVGSQNQFFIHKLSQKLQLWRPIDRVLANARRGQVLNWFKHLGTIPTIFLKNPSG